LFKAFGNPDPLEDANPTHCRSSTLEYYKKAISSYMPNRLSQWNALAQSGNPTRSIEVNDLMKKMKKKEVRKEGAPSKARRSIKAVEFVEVLKILMSKGEDTPVLRYGIPAMMKFQFHLIARIDDTTQVRL